MPSAWGNTRRPCHLEYWYNLGARCIFLSHNLYCGLLVCWVKVKGAWHPQTLCTLWYLRTASRETSTFQLCIIPLHLSLPEKGASQQPKASFRCPFSGDYHSLGVLLSGIWIKSLYPTFYPSRNEGNWEKRREEPLGGDKWRHMVWTTCWQIEDGHDISASQIAP